MTCTTSPDSWAADSLVSMLDQRCSRRTFGASPLAASHLIRLLWSAQGATSKGGRTTPSAHACYPLSVATYCTHVEGMSHGLYRYHTDQNRLEALPLGADFHVERLGVGAQPWLNEAPALMLIGADTGRMNLHFADQGAERGARFAHLEAGAAMQNVLLMAETMALAAVCVAGIEEHAPEFRQAFDDTVSPLMVLCLGERSE
ncbi:nitroreductase family protein [Kushneria phosphatilytica]|uniref:SagB/ThcOx family dehydrogenase n=1 Tax=Kushneria phosphatilytica TaxID=657387 RepID=A0A1S1NYQ1_9GAMM|nr:nitroreductase family protein [Kushneria phosphatilytica]OHV12903.1 hypothetical protein BH688_02525 [Kushneria phosphatilytica]QEL10767.1 SagB/ThcOx family dehydrogenase [Kushneria phosphatilytica]